MKGKNVYLYGASGHAKVVIDALGSVGVEVPCLIDDNPEVGILDGKPVVHSAAGLSPLIVSIGDCRIREMIVSRLGPVSYATAVHRRAIVSEKASIGDGSVVLAGAIVQSGARVGRHAIINTGASIDHDCSIGDFVHIAPHCTLCGNVVVGKGSWIGAGTTIIQGVQIGEGCYVGAGAVVVDHLPPYTLSYGNPARVVRSLDPPGLSPASSGNSDQSE